MMDKKYSVSGFGLGKDYIVTAKSEEEAIKKAQDSLKPVYGKTNKKDFKAKKFESGGGVGCPCKLKKKEFCEGGVAGDSGCTDCPCQKNNENEKRDSVWYYTVGGL
jgi:hypothetical protein